MTQTSVNMNSSSNVNEKDKKSGALNSSSGTPSTANASSDNAAKKVIVRKLPPTLTKEQFLDIVSPLPDHEYFYFCEADMSLGAYAFTRAYIYFKNYDDIFSFRDRFDNYVFVDSKSNEYPAIVEMAPYQRRLTPNNQKVDTKCNTIDQDSDFMKFVENLDKQTEAALPSCEAILEELEQKEKDKERDSLFAPKVMTPLLEFMKKKRDAKRSSNNRDRDRDHKGNRRRDDRDRDRDRDDKHYGGGGGGKNKHGNNNRDRDRDRDREYHSGKSSQKSNKDSSNNKNDFSNFKILSKSSGSQKSNNDSSNQKMSSNNSSQRNNSNNSGNFGGNKPSSVSGSSSKNNSETNKSNISSNNFKSNRDDSKQQSNSSQQPKDNSSRSSNQSNRDRDRDRDRDREANKEQQLDKDGKPVKNKDRPSIQIYNPAQRAAQRQQQQQQSKN